MQYIKNIIKSYCKWLLSGRWWNFVFTLVLIVLGILLVKYYKFLLETAGETIIKNHDEFIWYIIPGCIAIGYAHAKINRDAQYNILLLKFFSNPFFLSCIVCLTYGVVIDSSLALLYIVLYDENSIINYPYLDKTTVTVTLVLALLWGVNGILTMLGNIIWPDKTRTGILERKDNQQST